MENTNVPEKPRFEKREMLMLALVFAAVLLHVLFSRNDLSGRAWELPGLGLSASLLLVQAGFAAYMGKRGRWTVSTWLLLAASALLNLRFALFASEGMWLLNLPVALGADLLWTCSLAGERAVFTPRGAARCASRLLGTVFSYMPLPFRALGSRMGRRKGAVTGLLAALCALPLLAVVAVLLGQADQVFGDLLSTAFRVLSQPDLGSVLWGAARLAFFTLALFSFGYGLSARNVREAEEKTFQIPAAIPVALLSALSAVYALFAWVQFRYLFAGAESAAMAGGYAQYARSGFFQLTAVGVITVAVVIPSVTLCPRSASVRTLGAATALLTLVILASAAWRLALYVEAYGLTLLRVVTMWGILMIACAMIAAAIKAASPRLRIGGALAAVALASWICLNYANPEARVAEYNLRAWETGRLEMLDREYISGLSPDCRGALEKWADTDPEVAALKKNMETGWRARRPGWYGLSAPWLGLEDADPDLTLAVYLDVGEDVYGLSAAMLTGWDISCGVSVEAADGKSPLDAREYLSIPLDPLPEDESLPLFLRFSLYLDGGEEYAVSGDILLPDRGCTIPDIHISGSREKGFAAQARFGPEPEE